MLVLWSLSERGPRAPGCLVLLWPGAVTPVNRGPWFARDLSGQREICQSCLLNDGIGTSGGWGGGGRMKSAGRGQTCRVNHPGWKRLREAAPEARWGVLVGGSWIMVGPTTTNHQRSTNRIRRGRGRDRAAYLLTGFTGWTGFRTKDFTTEGTENTEGDSRGGVGGNGGATFTPTRRGFPLRIARAGVRGCFPSRYLFGRRQICS